MAQADIVDRAVAAALPLVPAAVVRGLAAPYIGGETQAEALVVVRRLNDAGLAATLDVLGEGVGDPATAQRAADAYVSVLSALSAGVPRCGVSVKPSALGGAFDWGLCHDLVAPIVERAAADGRFVRLDMEDAVTVDGTLDLYRRLRADGHDNVGIVLQARLWRTSADIAALADLRPDVRLCKGVYLEPAAVAMQDREAIRRSFGALLRRLLRAGCRVGIASHDEAVVADALAALDECDAPQGSWEFQLLLGVRADLARTLSQDGHLVRIYVPFGSDAVAYSVRRLRENPTLAGHVARALGADLLRATAQLARHGVVSLRGRHPEQ